MNGIDPTSTDKLPTIHPNQEIYISDPYKIDAAKVIAQGPQDYVDYGELGKQLINNYALAVQQNGISLNQVPKQYQQAVYQKLITNGTDKAATGIANVGFNLAAFLANPIGYTTGVAAQKGFAYANDAISGRNEYGTEDLLGYTPIMGTKYAEEHPYKSMAIDGAVTMLPVGLYNVGNFLSANGKTLVQNAMATANLSGVRSLEFPQINVGNTVKSVFQSGIKGSGKSGNATYRLGVGGYRPVVSNKATFTHGASGTPTVTYSYTGRSIPFGTYSPIEAVPVMPVLNIPSNTDPTIFVNSPERHIYEAQSFNPWIQDLQPGWSVGQYVPGSGVYSITGEAPTGNSIKEQSLTQESMRRIPGVYVPRKATYVSGSINGTPSNIYSGLGHSYTSENPNGLIIWEEE